MKIFKSIDDKIADLGFTISDKSEYGITYVRHNDKFGYTQKVRLQHKQSGRPILQSYDPDLEDSKGVGNTCIGISYDELKVFMKKFRKLLREWR